MLQIVSIATSMTLLLGSLALIASLLVRDSRQILHALGLTPSLVPRPAPLPPRVRMVSPPRRLAVRYAAALREAA